MRITLPTLSRLPFAAALLVCLSLNCKIVFAEESSAEAELQKQGRAIYEKTCLVCHGEKGEGVEKFDTEPLVGDLPISALAEVITETMPEDDPEACVGPDAVAVASYIHKAFYSEATQMNLKPPRVGLARLTKTQLRQSLADLYAYKNGSMWSGQDQGLKGTYYDGSGRNNNNKRIERTDRIVDFDFGNNGPGEGINPKSFFIDWRGALKANSTGTYEIIIRSSCSFVCYLGSYDRKFIDNHVQSGDKTEFRQSILLTAGRIYPLRIDFFQRFREKFKTSPQPPAKISLSWKTPTGEEEIIPPQNLVSISAPAAYSLQTQLPPDDRTYGYERGITVDRQWDESTTEAALEFSKIAIEELWTNHKRRNKNKADENRAQLRSFLGELIATAFRGPLSEEDRKTYVDQPVEAMEDDLDAIKRSLLMALKSPRFLYPMLDSDRSLSQQAANRLALTLFDSLPTDNWLFLKARGNDLEKEDQIRAAAERMVYDYRTRSKTRQFLYEWLNISDVKEIAKDAELFPEFNQALVYDLRLSLEAFLDEIVWSETSDYRQFFQADWSYTTDRLAEYYGETWKPVSSSGPGLQRSVADPENRLGLLTHPYLLSKLSYVETTSPGHRGVFLIRYMLGRTMRPPEDAFVPLAPDLHPDLTTRARVELQTSPPTCQVCHEKINALGFTLENYDAVGRYRLTEREQDINPTGFYADRAGEEVQFDGPKQLAEYLTTSNDAHQAFVNRAFQYFVKQPPAAFGPETLNQLTEKFVNSGYNIRKLLVEIAVIAATDSLEKESTDESPANPT